MKAVKVYDVDDVRIEEIPIPTITSREALVKIQSCGICSGDVTPWYIRRKVPLVIGHEPTGIIEAVGEEVDNFSVGERVFLHHHAPYHIMSYDIIHMILLCIVHIFHIYFFLILFF